MTLELKGTRLSHAYCRPCDIFYRASHAQCPRCYSSASITPPAGAKTRTRNVPARPRWIVNEDTFDNLAYDRSARTHCTHGHEFTPENTRMQGGYRRCRECRRVNAHKHKQRRQSANPGGPQ